MSARTSGLALTFSTLVLLASVACGSTAPISSTGSSPSSSNGQVAEDLTFTGALSGHMSTAHRGDTNVCAGSQSSLAAGPIVGDVGGKEVTLNIVKISFHGAGTYPAGGVGFDVRSDH